jgi:hypothetical protein
MPRIVLQRHDGVAGLFNGMRAGDTERCEWRRSS